MSRPNLIKLTADLERLIVSADDLYHQCIDSCIDPSAGRTVFSVAIEQLQESLEAYRKDCKEAYSRANSQNLPLFPLFGLREQLESFSALDSSHTVNSFWDFLEELTEAVREENCDDGLFSMLKLFSRDLYTTARLALLKAQSGMLYPAEGIQTLRCGDIEFRIAAANLAIVEKLCRAMDSSADLASIYIELAREVTPSL